MTDKPPSFWNIRSSREEDDDDYETDDPRDESVGPFYYSQYHEGEDFNQDYRSESRFGSGTYGASQRDDPPSRAESTPSWRQREHPGSSSERSSGSRPGSGLGSSLLNRGRGQDTPARQEKARAGLGQRLSAGLGAIRKRLPGGSGGRQRSTASSVRSLGQRPFDRGREPTGSERFSTRSADKGRRGGRPRFRITLPFIGKGRDKPREGKGAPSAPRGIKKAQPLPKSARRPRIKNEGLSLDLKLDIAGWGLVILSAIIFFGAISSNQGDLSRTLLNLIYQLVGVGWVAVPVALGGTGIWLIWRHFGERVPEADYVHIIGWAVTYLGLLATFHFVHLLTATVYNLEQLQALSDQAATAGHGGGWIGGQLYMLLMRSIGDVGTFFALLGWLGIGLLLATDLSLADIIGALSRAGRRVATRYKLRRAEQAARQRALATPEPPQREGLPRPAMASLGEADSGQRALPKPDAIPVVEEMTPREQPRIRHHYEEEEEPEPALVELEAEEPAASAGATVPLQPGLVRVRRTYLPDEEDEAKAGPETADDSTRLAGPEQEATRQQPHRASEILFGGVHQADPVKRASGGPRDSFPARDTPTRELDDGEEDDSLVEDERWMRPAQPRNPDRALQQLRARQRGAELSPAERAALQGSFARPAASEDDSGEKAPPREATAPEPTGDMDDAAYEDDALVYEPLEDEGEAFPVEDDETAVEIEPTEARTPRPNVRTEPAPRQPTERGWRPPSRQEQQGQRPTIPLPATPPSAMPSTAQRWEVPDFQEILDPASEQNINDDILLDRARIIEDTLASFGAPGKVVEVNPGPVITQFGVEPDYIEGRGGRRTRVKVQAIARLADDLALALAARSIRIEAPVPGKGFVGIEVPNAETSLVSLRDIMENREFKKIKSKLRIGLGQSVDGTPVAADLTAMPHLLIAGTTGSGKSVCVNAIIACLLLQNTPDDLRFIMVDPKRVELTNYNGIPHLVAPVVVDLERIVGVLKWVTREMDDRYKKFNERGARNIADYNARLGPDEKPLPYLVVVVDELADLMMLAPDETERVLTRLAQMSRATGIHLIISTQRPSVDIITGLIKANFPARIAFAVASSVDSRVILDQPGAERLLGRGDMLFQAPDAAAPVRLQGVFVSDAEINRLVRYWKGVHSVEDKARSAARSEIVSPSSPRSSFGIEPVRSRGEKYGRFGEREGHNFWEEVAARSESSQGSDEVDELYDEAVEVVRRLKKASVSLLQRQLRIGYTRAARLIDVMEERGVVGPPTSGSKPRKVIGYSDDEDFDDEMDDTFDDADLDEEDDFDDE